MAKRRDIVVAVIIAVGAVVSIGFIGLVIIGLMTQDGEFDLSGMGDKVGVIEMFGVIDETSGRPVIKQLDKWAENNSIQAIVLHINSPGGGVAISQEIYDAVKRVRDQKPIVAAMASVAASGGYYIACAGDRIIANPGTLTGSIGVIFQFHTYDKLMDKVGVGTETIKSGELKDVGTYSRPMTSKEELMLRSVVMDSYEQFVQVVAEGRGKELEEIYPLADGSIYTGLQAYNVGLVDTLGGLTEAIELAAELAGIEGEPSVIRPYQRRETGLFDLMGSLMGSLNRTVEAPFGGPRLLYLFQ